MTRHGSATPRLWGDQHPFERNHLQRSITLAGLAGLLAVTVIILVSDDLSSVVGVALVGAGLMAGLAAGSRSRYVRETEIGFAILRTRDGRFVLWTATALLVVGVLAVLVILP